MTPGLRHGGSDGPRLLPLESRETLFPASSFGVLSGHGARIGVCACHAGAGATTVALNLALMLHERTGNPVALVEADLRSPSLARMASRPSGWGVRGFATGCAGATDAMQRIVGQEGVWMMLGEKVDVPAPILGATASRLHLLTDLYPYVVVDLPPVLEYPDVVSMGRGIDGVLLVLEAERTRWQVARAAKDRLASVGIPLLGAVLNKRPRYIPDWLYRRL